MKKAHVKRKDVAAWRELRLLLAMADLRFSEACKLISITDPADWQCAREACWRGSTRGKAGRLRKQLLDFLNARIREQHERTTA